MTLWPGILLITSLFISPDDQIDLSMYESLQLTDTGQLVRVTADKESRDAAAVILGIVDISVPRETVWNVMVDCERAGEVVSSVKSCEVLQQDEEGLWDIRRHIIDHGFPLPRSRNEFRSNYEPPLSIQFFRTGGDLKVMEGSWYLLSLDDGNRTRVIYKARLATGQPVPRPLVRAAIRRGVPKILENLKRTSEAEQ